jgi:uncharacterized repeat protein (TIGR02543 family)
MISKPAVIALLLGTVSAFAQTTISPQPPAYGGSPSAAGSNVMLTGQILRSATGDYLVSSNKAFVLIMQTDGNLCEYFGSSATNMKPGAIWCSNSTGSGGRFSVQMHSTNNFCVTTGDEWGQGPALWCTNQVGSGSGPAFAILNGDGNFFIQTGTPDAPGALLWQTGNRFSQVALTAPASGTIQWQDGTACPPSCSQILREGSNLTLTAVPATGDVFNAWTGACAGKPNPCALTVAPGGMQNAGVSFNPGPVTLTISPRPTGGIVWNPQGSNPNTIMCGDFTSDGSIRTDCSLTVTKGTALKLQASTFHTDQYVYQSFTGACAGQNYVCDLTMDSSKTVSATFVTDQLTAASSTDGYITAATTNQMQTNYLSRGLSCGTSDGGVGTTCTAIVRPGTSINFSANPRAGFVFSAWGGACAGQGNPCTLGINSDVSVSSTYRNVGVFAVTATGTPNMSVIGGPINCRATCAGNVTQGSTLSLTAAADTGYYFTGWTGDCAGQGNPCTLQMNSNKTAAASAASIQTVTLTISPAPQHGILYTNNLLINCGDFGPNNPRTTCVATVNKGTSITLNADKFYNTGYHWSSFTGACAGQSYVCTLVMDSDKTTSATFSQ